ncbi:hypothetical protein [Rhodococcus sp. BS-15]|nr:hypothetical protein [Rhodococcus sp. BS-15]
MRLTADAGGGRQNRAVGERDLEQFVAALERNQHRAVGTGQ